MGNWFPVGKIGADKIYSSKELCEASEEQACYDIGNMDSRAVELVDDAVVENLDTKAALAISDASAAQDAVINNILGLLNVLVPDEVNLTQAEVDAFVVKLEAQLGA